MPLITPEELIVFLDLPADTQPADRAALVCTLTAESVAEAAAAPLTEPYPAGLRTIALGVAARLYHNPVQLRAAASGGESVTYAGDVLAVLTALERAQIRRLVGSGGPRWSFPVWDWSWKAADVTVSHND